MRVVIDTSTFVTALISADGASRAVLRLALQGQIRPVFGNALLSEYEDVIGRTAIFGESPLSLHERHALLDALLSVSDWVKIYFLWRPNLGDERDNHVVELAIAAGAQSIITGNMRDFLRADLVFPGLSIVTAAGFMERRKQS